MPAGQHVAVSGPEGTNADSQILLAVRLWCWAVSSLGLHGAQWVVGASFLGTHLVLGWSQGFHLDMVHTLHLLVKMGLVSVKAQGVGNGAYDVNMSVWRLRQNFYVLSYCAQN